MNTDCDNDIYDGKNEDDDDVGNSRHDVHVHDAAAANSTQLSEPQSVGDGFAPTIGSN